MAPAVHSRLEGRLWAFYGTLVRDLSAAVTIGGLTSGSLSDGVYFRQPLGNLRGLWCSPATRSSQRSCRAVLPHAAHGSRPGALGNGRSQLAQDATRGLITPPPIGE
jgi:hypothetical protein